MGFRNIFPVSPHKSIWWRLIHPGSTQHKKIHLTAKPPLFQCNILLCYMQKHIGNYENCFRILLYVLSFIAILNLVNIWISFKNLSFVWTQKKFEVAQVENFFFLISNAVLHLLCIIKITRRASDVTNNKISLASHFFMSLDDEYYLLLEKKKNSIRS